MSDHSFLSEDWGFMLLVNVSKQFCLANLAALRKHALALRWQIRLASVGCLLKIFQAFCFVFLRSLISLFHQGTCFLVLLLCDCGIELLAATLIVFSILAAS